MGLYVAIYLCLLPVCILINITRSDIIKKYLKFLLIITLSILPVFRDQTVGTDTSMYVDFFSWNMTWADWIHYGTELGFVSVIKTFHFIGIESYFFYLLFFSLLYNYLMITGIFKLSVNPLISIITYITISTLFFFNFNVIRQSLALAFFVYSLPFMFNKKYYKCYLIIIIGVFFHYSALLLLIFPIIYSNIEKRFKFTTIISVILIYAYTKLTTVLLGFLANFTGATRYNNYIGLTESNGGKICIFNILVLIVLTIIASINRQLFRDKSFLFFFYLFIVMVFTYFCVSFLGLKYEGPGRILNYFYVADIFIYPYFFNIVNVRYRMISYLFFYIFAFTYVCVVFTYVPLHGVLPYKFSPYVDTIL
ncbi:EpsG family protein [Tatumella sp. TA1]|nr:EpsG family protein [Tatumella sp. TA1]